MEIKHLGEGFCVQFNAKKIETITWHFMDMVLHALQNGHE
jgi:hypothetical protein